MRDFVCLLRVSWVGEPEARQFLAWLGAGLQEVSRMQHGDGGGGVGWRSCAHLLLEACGIRLQLSVLRERHCAGRKRAHLPASDARTSNRRSAEPGPEPVSRPSHGRASGVGVALTASVSASQMSCWVGGRATTHLKVSQRPGSLGRSLSIAWLADIRLISFLELALSRKQNR